MYKFKDLLVDILEQSQKINIAVDNNQLNNITIHLIDTILENNIDKNFSKKQKQFLIEQGSNFWSLLFKLLQDDNKPAINKLSTNAIKSITDKYSSSDTKNNSMSKLITKKTNISRLTSYQPIRGLTTHNLNNNTNSNSNNNSSSHNIHHKIGHLHAADSSNSYNLKNSESTHKYIYKDLDSKDSKHLISNHKDEIESTIKTQEHSGESKPKLKLRDVLKESESSRKQDDKIKANIIQNFIKRHNSEVKCDQSKLTAKSTLSKKVVKNEHSLPHLMTERKKNDTSELKKDLFKQINRPNSSEKDKDSKNQSKSSHKDKDLQIDPKSKHDQFYKQINQTDKKNSNSDSKALLKKNNKNDLLKLTNNLNSLQSKFEEVSNQKQSKSESKNKSGTVNLNRVKDFCLNLNQESKIIEVQGQHDSADIVNFMSKNSNRNDSNEQSTDKKNLDSAKTYKKKLYINTAIDAEDQI